MNKFNNKFIKHLIILLWLYIPTFTLILIVSVISFVTDIDIYEFTRDPAAVLNINPFTGFVSNIGILLWCTCAAICFFCATLLYSKKNKELTYFLFSSGIITTILLLDDLFLFHEKIFPRYLHIYERIVFLIYGIIILIYLIKFSCLIIKTEFIFLLFAFGFFGLSIVVDTLPRGFLPWHHLFEDGFKLFGIVSWFGYYMRFCFQTLQFALFETDLSNRKHFEEPN